MIKLHCLPPDQEKSTFYHITVNSIAVVAEFSRVSAMPFNTPWPGHQRDKSQTEEAPFLSFEGDETAVVTVSSPNPIQKAVVRPLAKKVSLRLLSDHTVQFELKEHGQYVLEINGLHRPLTLFFNPLRDFAAEAEQKKKAGRKVRYYGPGVHYIKDLELESHTTLTVDAGAILYGSISAFAAEDIEINGYGVIDNSCEKRDTEGTRRLLLPTYMNNSPWEAAAYDPEHPYFPKDKRAFASFMEKTRCLRGILRFYFCQNVKCEGIVMRDAASFCAIPAACDQVLFDNVKTIGMWRYNSDGIDLFNSSNVTVKHSFLRNFDDVMVIKGIVGWDFKANENITVDDCVLWCDWGAACEIGAETNAPEYKNILFKNCHVLYDAAGSMLRIQHCNRADIHHVRYENIHLEFHADQMNFQLQKSEKQPYEYQAGAYQPEAVTLIIPEALLYGVDGRKGCIHDVEFDRIYLHLEEGIEILPAVKLYGLHRDACMTNVSFSRWYVNGKRIKSLEKLNLKANDYAYNITLD